MLHGRDELESSQGPAQLTIVQLVPKTLAGDAQRKDDGDWTKVAVVGSKAVLDRLGHLDGIAVKLLLVWGWW